MKRFAILVLATLAISGCKSKIPGFTCEKDTDCTSGKCDTVNGVCVTPTCAQTCGTFEDCLKGVCAASFVKLAIAPPVAGAQLTPPFDVAATLTRSEGSTANPPAKVTLTATPATGTAESFDLLLVAGTTQYKASITTSNTGAYTLKAQSTDLNLTSDPVAVTIKAAICDPPCTRTWEACVDTHCYPAFNALSITEPLADSKPVIPFTVTAHLTRLAGAVHDPPATVDLIATHGTDADEHFTLSLVAGSTDYTNTSVTTAKTGTYSLKAHSADTNLDSTPVSVDVQPSPCTPACKANLEECDNGQCTTIFTGIAINTPKDGDPIVSTATIHVTLTRKAGTTTPAPTTVTISGSTVKGDTYSATINQVAGKEEYDGALALTKDGPWTIAASTPEIAGDAKVNVTVTDCPAGQCNASQDCDGAGGCVDSFIKLEISNPTGGTVGKTVPIEAKLTARAGTSNQAPTSLDVTAYNVGSKHTETVKLNKDNGTSPYHYASTWTPKEDGQYTLVAAAAGLTSATVNVTVDKTGPTFTVSVSPAPTRTSAQTDPATGYDKAFRRDEAATVAVTSPDTDVDASKVVLTVTSATGSKQITPTLTNCAGPGYCGSATVQLWDPGLEMNTFRGTVALSATGIDLLGNAGTPGTRNIAVTRWKWAVDADPGAPVKQVKTSPAIGSTGTIYIGTSTGKAVALNPDGSNKWEFATGGPITASIVVGDVDSVETAFVGGIDAVNGGAVWGITDANFDKSPAPICIDGIPGDSAIGSPVLVSAAVGDTASPTAVFAFGSSSGTAVFGVRPKAIGALKRCPALSLITYGVPADSGFGADNSGSIYFGDEGGYVNSIALQATGWKLNWSKQLNAGNQPTNPAIGAGVAGGGGVGVGTIFHYSLAGDQSAQVATDGPTWNAIVGTVPTGSLVIAGTSQSSLYGFDEAFTSATTPTLQVKLTGKLRGAPALGHDGILHVSSDSKKLYALDLQGNSLWAADLGAASEASPALACNPSDATLPGIVYVGANDGKLYAFITDSKGIDVKSPWPKFHRDPRNSGDSTVDLATFECK